MSAIRCQMWWIGMACIVVASLGPGPATAQVLQQPRQAGPNQQIRQRPVQQRPIPPLWQIPAQQRPVPPLWRIPAQQRPIPPLWRMPAQQRPIPPLWQQNAVQREPLQVVVPSNLPNKTPQVGVRKISSRIRNLPPSIRARPLPRKPATTKIDPRRFSSTIIVKFHEGSAVRQTRPGEKTVAVVEVKVTPDEVARLGLIGLQHGQVRLHLDDVNRLLQDDVVERVMPVFRTANEARIAQHRAEGMARSGVDLADLGLYLHIVLKPGAGTPAAERLVDRLNASPVVEIAYPAPIARLGGSRDMQMPRFNDRQQYLGPAPLGIDAAATWSFDPVGGRGKGVRVADTEGGWDFLHEDFPRAIRGARQLSLPQLDPATVDHGTAVFGIIAAQDNGLGVTGIAPSAELWVSPIQSGGLVDVAFSIYAASWQLRPGDVMIVLEHFPGPESPSPEDPSSPQAGYVPVEYYPATSDAVRYATARGIIVVEIAGNGAVDLDNDLYYMLDRAYDSGAIFVGATRPDGTPEMFSNSGSRLDLNAWGDEVMTLGYGAGDGRFLTNGDPHRCYRTDFNGTCSAASIVTGAIASVQGVVRNQVSASLTPWQMRYLLAATGTPQAPGRLVGSRPDLSRALALLFGVPGQGGYDSSIVPNEPVTSYDPAVKVEASATMNRDWTSPPAMQLSGLRLRIYLDNRFEGVYAFSVDGSIAFTKLDGSVDRRLRFAQSGSDLTLFTATGSPVRGIVTATGFKANLPLIGGRAHVLSGAP